MPEMSSAIHLLCSYIVLEKGHGAREKGHGVAPCLNWLGEAQLYGSINDFTPKEYFYISVF